MKSIVFSSFLLVGLISEFSLAGILNMGIGGVMQQALITYIKSRPPYPIVDKEGKFALLYPNFKDETLEETEQHLNEYVGFYLYTRKNPKDPQTLFINDTYAFKNSNFDLTKPTRIVAHGWIQSYDTVMTLEFRNAFLKHDDYNVIMVDWGIIAYNYYTYAYRCVYMVGQHLSKMINFLVDQGMQPSQLHLIGHSLGAHVVGMGARHCKIKVPHIMALDPAYPGFEYAGPGERISTEDAEYVQVLHVNSGHLGFPIPLGHSDFYGNGGVEQPICPVDPLWGCSHMYAIYYYSDSISNKKGYWSRKCDNYDDYQNGKCHSNPAALMGTDEPDMNVTGVYYFDTTKSFPYALGLEGIADK